MKKGALHFMMALAISASLLAGCGSSGTSSSTQATTAVETQETAPQTQEQDAAADETTAQQSVDETSEAGSVAAVTTSVAGWNITMEDYQINDSLENVSVALGYTGVQTSNFEKNADEGMTFCMVKLLIEKDGSSEAIDWDKMVLTDSDGNTYNRIDDEFLNDLGMKRMPGNSLNFGSNEGWIVYEVNADASGLTLGYDFESESYSQELQ